MRVFWLAVLLVAVAAGCAIQSIVVPEPFRSAGVTGSGIFTLTVRRADAVRGFMRPEPDFL